MSKCIYRSFITTSRPAEWAIRHYVPQDAAQIKKIALPVLHDLMSASPSLTEQQRNKLYQTEIQSYLSVLTTQVVLNEDSEIGGFITYHLQRSLRGSSSGIIEHLAIDPRFRNQKLGTKLLNQAVNDLKDKGAHVISLQVTSEKVMSFYTRNEFKIVRHPDIRFGNTGRMVKLLNPSNRPVLGPFINRAYMIDKKACIKGLLGSVLIFTTLSFLDQKPSSK